MKKIIMGIDPGIANCGIGIIFIKNGIDYHYETIKTDNSFNSNYRIQTISNELEKIIKKYKPDVISFEKLFVHKNMISVIGVAGIIGVINSLCKKYNIVIHDYSPMEIKKNFTNNNRAEKHDIIHMINFLFKNKNKISDHEADALAIAITDLKQNEYYNLFARGN